MIFSEKLRLIRKSKGITQDQLAEKLNVSRQAVAKWESGLIYPDISNLIQISDFFNVTIDYLIRDQECMVNIEKESNMDLDKLILFRLEANVNTYAAYMPEAESTRLDSHDFPYSTDSYTYHDPFVGVVILAGEACIWHAGTSNCAMTCL